MSANIHPTAVIDRSAEIADGVVIEAYAIVGPRVVIGENTRVRSHAHIVCDSVIGRNCDIHPGSVLGGDPQDLKYKGEESRFVMGDNNIVRECVTINRGTGLGGGRTVIGNNNLLMAYSHIAHDCIIDNHVIITNCAQLAGHIRIEDMAIVSGMVGIHHFVTVGTMSFLAGFSAVRTDVPPYMIVDGAPARVRKLNLEGLKRRQVPQESIDALKKVFRMIYRSEMSRAEAVAKIRETELASDPVVRNLLDHYGASEAGYQGRALEAFRQDNCRCRKRGE